MSDDAKVEFENEDNNRHSFLIASIISVYNTVMGVIVCWAMYLLITSEGFRTIFNAESQSGNEISILIIMAAFCMSGGGLGAILHCLVGLHIHAAIIGDFSSRYIGSYIIGPFGAAFLALAMFCIIQGGLLTLAGDISAPREILGATLFYIAIGVLCGFAYDTVVLRLDAVAKQMFGGKQESFLESALSDAKRNQERNKYRG